MPRAFATKIGRRHRAARGAGSTLRKGGLHAYPEELEQVLPAETSAFPSPIPTQCVSSDEYMPCPQTEKQREFEARVEGVRLRARPQAGHEPAQVLPVRGRHGGGFRRDERDLRPALRRIARRGADAGYGERAREGAQGPVHHGHAHALPARGHAGHGVRLPARDGRQARLEPGHRREGADDQRPHVPELLQGGLPRQRHQDGVHQRLVLGRREVFVPDQRHEVRRAREGQQGVGHEAHVLARDLHRRARRLARQGGGRGGEAEARLVEGLHHRRQHQQAPLEVAVPARRREDHVSVLREARQVEQDEPDQGQRLHPQGPVPAVGREGNSRISSSTRTCATWARPRRTGRSSISSSTTRAGAGPVPTRRRTRGSISRRPGASNGSPTSPRFPRSTA